VDTKELETLINTRSWPQSVMLECQEKRMTPCELIRAHMAPVVKKGPPKLIEEMSQRELLDEIIELGTPARVRLLERETHREVVAKAATQWNREATRQRQLTAASLSLKP
jgi:hypothetical protein